MKGVIAPNGMVCLGPDALKETPQDLVNFSPEWALRFLDHEAKRCRDRDSHEALCLLLPALLKVFKLQPCDDFQALEFEGKFHKELRFRTERERGMA
jgi:hypothetical protein